MVENEKDHRGPERSRESNGESRPDGTGESRHGHGELNRGQIPDYKLTPPPPPSNDKK